LLVTHGICIDSFTLFQPHTNQVVPLRFGYTQAVSAFYFCLRVSQVVPLFLSTHEPGRRCLPLVVMHKPCAPSLEHTQARSSPYFSRSKQRGPDVSLPTYFAEIFMLLPGLPLVLLSKQGFAIRRILANKIPKSVFSVFLCCYSQGCDDPCKRGTLKWAAGQGARASARSFFFLYFNFVSANQPLSGEAL
jgi:hypothetical protein